MSGRIRTVKPEWLEDELLASASSDARVLSIALILLADDYGNGRASVPALASDVWKFDMSRDDGAHAGAVIARARAALKELELARFVMLYEVDGQRYFTVRNWKKHQRVDKPGKPRVPGPGGEKPTKRETARVAYFIRGATTGLIKIGESQDPVARLADLAKAGSERLELVAVGGVEADHHAALADDRVHGEWFRPSERVLAKIREYGGDVGSPIASAGYEGERRVMSASAATIPESVAKVRERVATDPDLDPDLEVDRSGADAPPPDPLETLLRDRVVHRWRVTFEAARGQFPAADDAAARSVVEWLVANAPNVGRAPTDILDSVLAAYWREDWPRSHANRASLRNFLSQADRLLAALSAPAEAAEVTVDFEAERARIAAANEARRKAREAS